jgi:hypothetical protein
MIVMSKYTDIHLSTGYPHVDKVVDNYVRIVLYCPIDIQILI